MADPKTHRHRCEVCGRQFVCHFGCLLDDEGDPLEIESRCDDCYHDWKASDSDVS